MVEADRMIARSPIAGMKQRRREKPIRLAPSLDEFRTIVASIRAQKYADTAEESADFIEFLGLAGLGQAEASALTWADVNLDRGQLLTFRQKTRTGFAVPIFPQLRPLLVRPAHSARMAARMTFAQPEPGNIIAMERAA